MATTVDESHQSLQDAYYATRFTIDSRREDVWRHISKYLQRWVDQGGATLDLAAGYADFSNHIRSARRVAVDVNRAVVDCADDGVEALVGDATDLDAFADGEFSTVFASNFLEHLGHDTIQQLLAEIHRVLRPGGRLILIPANFRLVPRRYFDDYTHRTIWTDRSLSDRVASMGFEVVHSEPRFLPLTMKSRLSFGHQLVPLYLRLPGVLRIEYRPLAGQMLVVAKRP